MTEEIENLNRRLVWLLESRKVDLKARREFVQLLADDHVTYTNDEIDNEIQADFIKWDTRIQENKAECKKVRDRLKEIQ